MILQHAVVLADFIMFEKEDGEEEEDDDEEEEGISTHIHHEHERLCPRTYVREVHTPPAGSEARREGRVG